MIHHLNCATMNPIGTPPVVAHVLLVERADGLLLVDTGFGSQDLATPKRLGQPFRALMRPALDPAESALAQIQRLGFRREDVTDIVLTHLDLDHAGGIGDFPRARVHVHVTELEVARNPRARDRARYVAAQWGHDPTWVTHRADRGDTWQGLASVTALDDDVVLVPLHGHSAGHCGVAVRRPEGGWLLHAGDSYFHAGETETPPRCPASLRLFQRVVAHDNGARVANQARLRELRVRTSDVTVFSAHDATEFAALARAE